MTAPFALDGIHHVAYRCRDAKAHVERQGIEVLGPTCHDIFKSI